MTNGSHVYFVGPREGYSYWALRHEHWMRNSFQVSPGPDIISDTAVRVWIMIGWFQTWPSTLDVARQTVRVTTACYSSVHSLKVMTCGPIFGVGIKV